MCSLLVVNGALSQGVSTDPVGFITLPVISTAGASPTSPALSLICPTLVKPILYQGLVTDVNVGTRTITVAGPLGYTGTTGSHYVELISDTTPAQTGSLANIDSNTSTTITLPAGEASYMSLPTVGETIRIRQHVTIADVFGATNSAGLLAGEEASSADEVLVYNGDNFTSYFYFVGAEGFPAGWYKADFTPSNSQPIWPNESLVVKRKSAGNINITFTGTVKKGNTIFPITTGLNVISTVSAQGLTLNTSGLYTGNSSTGVAAGEEASAADEVLIYTGSTPASYFYFVGAEGFPAGWYSAGFESAGTTALEPGKAIVIKRKTGGNFNWALPSPSTF